MSEEEQNKLNKILYYSDIHPADTEFINNIIFNLCQERNIANSILTELEKWCEEGIKDEMIKFEYGTKLIGEPIKIHMTAYEFVLDKILELKERYK